MEYYGEVFFPNVNERSLLVNESLPGLPLIPCSVNVFHRPMPIPLFLFRIIHLY